VNEIGWSTVARIVGAVVIGGGILAYGVIWLLTWWVNRDEPKEGDDDGDIQAPGEQGQ
jgi:hypothetical protein